MSLLAGLIYTWRCLYQNSQNAQHNKPFVNSRCLPIYLIEYTLWCAEWGGKSVYLKPENNPQIPRWYIFYGILQFRQILFINLTFLY